MSADILSTLLAANLAASAAIVLVVLIRKSARRMMGARLAYWLWAVPVLAGLATLLPARDAGTALAPAAPIQPIAEATVDIATSWAKPADVIAAPAEVDIALLLASVWAAGVLCYLGLMLLQQQRTLRALKLAPGKAPRSRSINRAANNFGPAVVGVLKPLLVVPADFEERFSPPEQDLVLAHEREHLSAGHTRINAALVVLTSLNWFNPLVHWAARLARVDQELACDAAVVERFPARRGVYAEALFKAQVLAAPLPLGCTWPSRSSRLIKERMTMLASKTPGRARRMAGAGFIAIALLGAGLAAWAQKPPAPAVVTVDKNGAVTWDGKPLADRKALAEQAKNQASANPHIRLTVDANAPYPNVELVMNEAQRAGMVDIAFASSGVLFTTPTPPPPGLPPPPKDIPDPVRIKIDASGALSWNDAPVDKATLDRNLKAAAAAPKWQPEIHLYPDQRATIGQVEQVLAAARKAGLTKSGIVGKASAGSVPMILAGNLS